MRLGFSTGCLYTSLGTRDALRLYRDLGIKYVEIGPSSAREIVKNGPQNLSSEDFAGFEYLSIHAPKFEYQKDKASLKIIQKIRRIHELHPLDRVVVHPDPVKDFSVWAESGLPVGVENMDKEKPSGRTVEDIENILAQYPEFGLVLDVNHIWTNDRSMRLAAGFLEKLGDRLVQYHVSGYRDLHDPLFETKQDEILGAIKDTRPVMIVESLLRPETVASERDYISNILTSRS